MKTILFFLITTLITSSGFAIEPIKKIEESKTKVVKIDVAQRPVNARLVYTPFSPGSVYKKMTIEIDVVLEWRGCGWFDDDAKILLLNDRTSTPGSDLPSMDIAFLTLTDAAGYACTGLENDQRVFTYSFFPVGSETLVLGNTVKVQTFFTPNPKGKNYIDIFDRVEITQPDGTIMTVKP